MLDEKNERQFGHLRLRMRLFTQQIDFTTSISIFVMFISFYCCGDAWHKFCAFAVAGSEAGGVEGCPFWSWGDAMVCVQGGLEVSRRQDVQGGASNRSVPKRG